MDKHQENVEEAPIGEAQEETKRTVTGNNTHPTSPIQNMSMDEEGVHEEENVSRNPKEEWEDEYVPTPKSGELNSFIRQLEEIALEVQSKEATLEVIEEVT